jgi:hypothetical protein
MERHIRSQHGSSEEPIYFITGLIRGKSFHKPMQSMRASADHNGREDNSNRKFWETADKVRITRELELLRELEGDLFTICSARTNCLQIHRN